MRRRQAKFEQLCDPKAKKSRMMMTRAARKPVSEAEAEGGAGGKGEAEADHAKALREEVL